MQPTELTIARHGQAWCNVEQTIGGLATCRGLTPAGHQQAARLAARLAVDHQQRPVVALYTSPLRRAPRKPQPPSRPPSNCPPPSSTTCANPTAATPTAPAGPT